jgi:hypothetical protein
MCRRCCMLMITEGTQQFYGSKALQELVSKHSDVSAKKAAEVKEAHAARNESIHNPHDPKAAAAAAAANATTPHPDGGPPPSGGAQAAVGLGPVGASASTH